MKACSIDGCDRRLHAKGYCRPHYWRWRDHGNPTEPERPRRDAWRHGTVTGYDRHGCRCGPCRAAKKTPPRRLPPVPVREVSKHVTALVASGWTTRDIAALAHVSHGTVNNVRRRKVTTVRQSTADALLSVELKRTPKMVDAVPLLRWIAARGVTANSMSTSDRRVVERARVRGTIRDDTADRLCVRYLRLTLEEVYGPDWDREAAA